MMIEQQPPQNEAHQGGTVKKRKSREAHLELARGMPRDIKRSSSAGFQPGDKVKLRESAFLQSAHYLMGQRFSEGDVGKVTGHTPTKQIIFFSEEEEWVVDAANLAPLNKRARK